MRMEEVTLEDNEDLKDVVEQQLDPLRITVELNSAGSGRPLSKPSGSSHGRVKQESDPWETCSSHSGKFSDSSSDSGPNSSSDSLWRIFRL
nr:protein NBR1 homolog isoform X2 [Ipomoea batatas]